MRRPIKGSSVKNSLEVLANLVDGVEAPDTAVKIIDIHRPHPDNGVALPVAVDPFHGVVAHALHDCGMRVCHTVASVLPAHLDDLPWLEERRRIGMGKVVNALMTVPLVVVLVLGRVNRAVRSLMDDVLNPFLALNAGEVSDLLQAGAKNAVVPLGLRQAMPRT